MAQHKLVIAEKPSVAQNLAAVIGATVRKDGYLEGNGWRVSWCVGHLAGLADADSYDPKYAKWRYDDLPILPEHWQMVVGKDKKKQFAVLKQLMNAQDVTEVVNACDAGREGELIFRSVYELAGCKKPMKRLWISSMEDSAIREGFANLRPGADYDGLRDAALCRAKADWLVGINATRLFSVLYHRTLNIGRVMSPTLALIVQREAEIDIFKPVPFYTVALELPGLTVSGERMADMVADMLQNMVYLGHTVNLRYSTKSYKDKKKRERPRSEWLIFEHTHEALVDQETWDIVQEVRSHKRRRTNMDEQNMFSGLVYCADCGMPMVLHRAHTMKPEQNNFTCRTYKKDGSDVCSAHYVREVALKEIVLETIRRATEFARSDPERFAAYIQQKQSTEVAKEIRGLERELSAMRKRDGELDVVFKRMYEDSALGRVSNEQFRLLSEAYSKEKAQLAEDIPAAEERLEKLRSSMANAKNFIAKARKFTDMTELTPELLRTFVAKIIVYEKEVKYSKHAPQKIQICFRDFNLNETDDVILCGETTEKADSATALPA